MTEAEAVKEAAGALRLFEAMAGLSQRAGAPDVATHWREAAEIIERLPAERDSLRNQRDQANETIGQWRTWADEERRERRAAEARAEAAEQALLVYNEWRVIADRHPGFLARDSRTMAEKAVARAALAAARPEQRQVTCPGEAACPRSECRASGCIEERLAAVGKEDE